MSHLMTWLPIALTILAFGYCARLKADVPSAPEADEIVQNVRLAVGWEQLSIQAGIRVEGTATHAGAAGPFSLVFTPRGKFVRKIGGPLSEQTGFDGKNAWAVDWTGMPRRLDLGDAESARVAVAVQTGQWLGANGPLSIERVTRAGDRVVVSVRPKGGVVTFEVFIDTTTWLPTRIAWPGPLGEQAWSFEDYRDVLGGKIPFRAVHSVGGLKDTFVVRGVTQAAVEDAGFAAPHARPDDFRFDPAVSDTVEVKRVASGHLFVRPKVNGEEVGWFVLDTGSGVGMAIAPSIADRLKMPAVGRVVRGGAGTGGEAAIRHGESFQLGPVTIKGSYYVELPSEFFTMMKRLHGLELAGTCGYDLFARTVSELDLKEPSLRLHDRESYTLPAGQWQPLVLHQRIPCVRCEFEGGHDGLFRFDTGAGKAIVFHTPAVERLKLLEGRSTRAMSIGGVGGTVEAQVGKVGGFRPAGRTVGDATALFVTGKAGALTDPYTLGTFGTGLLGPARVVFDYPHSRVAIVDGQ
jgi:hypothetical protein